MKAAVTTAEHGFDVVDLPDPAPGPEELVICVAACGVCGSDIKAQPFAPPGMVMGHELGGEVVAVGSAVDGWKQGTNAAVLPVNVLIVGAGGVGLTTLAWALEKGGVRVTVADPDPDRRETALAMGATDVMTVVSEAEASSYDAAIECVGRPELVQACQPALRPQGRLVISGACAEPTYIEPVTALLKELTIRYSVAYCPDEFLEVISAFASGVIDPSPMIGPTFGLHRIAEAFDTVRDARVRGRVLVTPEECT
jgi:threonine dehydrogenase-like Zn-dependent dehydrogenase